MTQQDLAALVGSAQEMVGSVVKTFEQEGFIDLKQGTYYHQKSRAIGRD